MSEEKLMVLRMIAEGKITAEEGARLLEALGDKVPVSHPTPTADRALSPELKSAEVSEGVAQPVPPPIPEVAEIPPIPPVPPVPPVPPAPPDPSSDGAAGPVHFPNLPSGEEIERIVTGAMRQAKIAIGPALREGMKGLQGLRALRGVKTFVHTGFIGRTENRVFEERIGLQPGDEVRVQTVSGDVSVGSIDGETMAVRASCRVPEGDPVGSDGWTLSLHRNGSVVDIHLQTPADAHSLVGETDYDILLPSWARVVASSVSGDIAVSGMGADLRLQSVSGDVKVQRCSADVEVKSTSGDVRLEHHCAGQMSAESVSGDVTVTLQELGLGSKLRAKTISGDVTVVTPAEAGLRATIKTFSGDITTAEGLAAVSGGGNQRQVVSGDGETEMWLESLSGDISLKAAHS